MAYQRHVTWRNQRQHVPATSWRKQRNISSESEGIDGGNIDQRILVCRIWHVACESIMAKIMAQKENNEENQISKRL